MVLSPPQSLFGGCNDSLCDPPLRESRGRICVFRTTVSGRPVFHTLRNPAPGMLCAGVFPGPSRSSLRAVLCRALRPSVLRGEVPMGFVPLRDPAPWGVVWPGFAPFVRQGRVGPGFVALRNPALGRCCAGLCNPLCRGRGPDGVPSPSVIKKRLTQPLRKPFIILQCHPAIKSPTDTTISATTSCSSDSSYSMYHIPGRIQDTNRYPVDTASSSKSLTPQSGCHCSIA